MPNQYGSAAAAPNRTTSTASTTIALLFTPASLSGYFQNSRIYPPAPARHGRNQSLLWVPSQNGLLADCLQPHNATFWLCVISNLTGVMLVVLCEPSQNGWVLERPQAHHQ